MFHHGKLTAAKNSKQKHIVVRVTHPSGRMLTPTLDSARSLRTLRNEKEKASIGVELAF